MPGTAKIGPDLRSDSLSQLYQYTRKWSGTKDLQKRSISFKLQSVDTAVYTMFDLNQVKPLRK